jgi:hypothetical protein
VTITYPCHAEQGRRGEVGELNALQAKIHLPVRFQPLGQHYQSWVSYCFTCNASFLSKMSKNRKNGNNPQGVLTSSNNYGSWFRVPNIDES